MGVAETKKKWRFIVRVILSALLIWGVYSETGKWTAIFATLTFIALETQGWLIEKLKEQKDDLRKM